MTKIIAHRGYHKEYIANTLKAFESAVLKGADGIELDVHLSKDHEIVVFHDFDLYSVLKEHTLIGHLPLEEISKIDLGDGSQIPTLESVLKLLKDLKVSNDFILNVELKAGSALYPNIEEKVLNLCYKYLSPDQLIFSSFDHESLIRIKQLNPQAKIGVLTACALVEPWIYLNRLRADYYHPHFMSLHDAKVQALLLEGVSLNPYTVNALPIGKKMIEMKLNGIITDEVVEMIKIRNEVRNETGY